jgi:predicted ATPase
LETQRRDAYATAQHAEACLALSAEHGMEMWHTESAIFRGWARAEQGRLAEGITEMRRGMAAFEAMGNVFIMPFFQGLLAEQYARIGRLERGLTLISRALATVERTGERWYEAELYRCRGMILLERGDHSGAESAFQQALDIARYQQAKAFELRAATCLAHLVGNDRQTFEVAETRKTN